MNEACEASAALERELDRFLAQHPALRVLPPGHRVQCTLTGHELPCQLAALQAYTASKKYQRLNKVTAAWDYQEYEPHIVPSTKNQHQLFCKLTLRHFNRTPEQVLHHVRGQRYQKALKKYEECQKAGVEYVPACLLQRRRQRRRQWDQQPNSSQQPCQKGEFWEPLPSDEDGEETDDSMSDLYPPEMFPERSPAKKEGNDEVMTDSDEEVAKPAAEGGKGSEAAAASSVAGGKRGKKQAGGSFKKFKSQHRKPKSVQKAVNGNDVM